MQFSGQSSTTDALNRFVVNRIADARGCLAAKVIALYPDRLMVDVEYLTDTRFEDGTNSPFSRGFDIPLHIQSGNQGNARITFPITIGDTVLVLFSDRDYANLLVTNGQSLVSSNNPTPHPETPIGAIPCIFTVPNARTLDTVNIVVENGSTNIKIAPSGDITMNTSTSVRVNAPLTAISGDLTVGGNTTIEGDTTINGDATLNGEDNTVTNDLAISGIDFVTHTHSGVDSGNDTSGAPVPPAPPTPPIP